MFEGFKAFLQDCARKGEEEPGDLMDIMEPLEVSNLPGVGSKNVK